MLNIDIQKTLYGSQGEMCLDVKLDIEKGAFVALMGESGSGKTTLLRVLAGLEKAEGHIEVDGVSWQNEMLQSIVTQKREIGFVFQDYALFANMTVEQNLLYVADDKSLAKTLMETTELKGLAARNVKGLSGGQKQRVAVCRAMMRRPKVLLMDEPFSALHPKMRNKLHTLVKQLHMDFGITTIMVSHEVESVYALAKRVIVLHQGKIISDGSVKEVLKSQVTKTKVLGIKGSIATVCIAGELLEVEVDKDTPVGTHIQISLQVKKA